MKRTIAIIVVFGVLAVPPAFAGPANAYIEQVPGFRESIAKVRFGEEHTRSSVSHGTGRNSRAQQASAAFALGFVGMLAGGWVGARVQPDCRCQDRGLQGAVIGLPLGALVGGIIGWRLAQ
jgi:hypothetical protein